MKYTVFARLFFLISTTFLSCDEVFSYQHPFLYYSSDDIALLQRQAKTSHWHIFSRLREAAEIMKENPQMYKPPYNWHDFSRSWNEIYGNSLASLAFYCVLNTSDHEAFQLARNILKRFTVLKNWRCAINLEDDVPVAHSLVAIATAYDFLWNRLDPDERHLTGEKIKIESRILYKRSFEKWWGKAYIQNHVATNYMALMTAAIVLKSDNEALLWLQKAHLMLNRTMFLLSFVTDGTLEEGVSYGSYTSRSLTQYVALAKRHLNIDLTRNEWLINHFWFLYRTILPGFNGTLGVADSNGKWFYGPESQLVFLDKMVLKNGSGNWLAKEIQRMRKDGKSLTLAKAHRFATLYTEFLFYDEKIGERPPSMCQTECNSALHVFDDWGVAVFEPDIEPADVISRPKLSTFVSFKCGVLHGKAINKIVNTKPWPWIDGWQRFNPGHEHPDHGSFTFYPNGIPFITEALYGPKYTWLNNVLSFGRESPINIDYYTGQLTEAENWLKYRHKTFWQAKGTILAAAAEKERVYITGEYSRWYDKDLGLQSVYRSLLLVRSNILLVCDTIVKNPGSSVDKMSAFFHNRFAAFSITRKPNGERFAKVLQNGEIHRIYWASSDAKTIDVRSHYTKFKAEAGIRSTNFVNITTSIPGHSATMVYIFAGNNQEVKQLDILDGPNDMLVININLGTSLLRILMPSRPREYSLPPRFKDCVEVSIEYGVRTPDWKMMHLVKKIAVFTSLLVLVFCLCYFFQLKGRRMTKKILFKILEKIGVLENIY